MDQLQIEVAGTTGLEPATSDVTGRRLADGRSHNHPAGRAFPLVTIHREQVDPDVCWIGRVLGIDRGRVSLLEIGPDAMWEDTPEEYRVIEITQVNFGGDYENALHLVGGAPADSKGR